MFSNDWRYVICRTREDYLDVHVCRSFTPESLFEAVIWWFTLSTNEEKGQR